MSTDEAEKRTQKEQHTAQTKALKAHPVRIKPYAKPKKALVTKKKVMRFVGGDTREGSAETPAKQSSRGRAIKPRVIFEEGLK